MVLTSPDMLPLFGYRLALEHGRRVEGVSLVQRHALPRDVDKVPEHGGRLRVVQGRIGRGWSVRLEHIVTC